MGRNHMTHKLGSEERSTEKLSNTNDFFKATTPPRIATSTTHETAIMATELTVQSERAFQKQPHIFLNSKSKAKSSKVGKGGRRWYKDVGLGFRTPKTAIEGNYIGMWDSYDATAITVEEMEALLMDELLDTLRYLLRSFGSRSRITRKTSS